MAHAIMYLAKVDERAIKYGEVFSAPSRVERDDTSREVKGKGEHIDEYLFLSSGRVRGLSVLSADTLSRRERKLIHLKAKRIILEDNIMYSILHYYFVFK